MSLYFIVTFFMLRMLTFYSKRLQTLSPCNLLILILRTACVKKNSEENNTVSRFSESILSVDIVKYEGGFAVRHGLWIHALSPLDLSFLTSKKEVIPSASWSCCENKMRSICRRWNWGALFLSIKSELFIHTGIILGGFLLKIYTNRVISAKMME